MDNNDEDDSIMGQKMDDEWKSEQYEEEERQKDNELLKARDERIRIAAAKEDALVTTQKLNDTLEPTALQKINVRRMLNHVEKSISESLTNNFLGEVATPETIIRFEHQAKSMLSMMKGITQSSVCAKVEKMTWAKLYPSFFKRYIARIIQYLLRWGWLQTYKERWYHHILPFEINRTPIFIGDVEDAIETLKDKTSDSFQDLDGFQDYLNNNCKICTQITLPTPHDMIAAEIILQPATPIENIQVSFTLS